MFAEISLKSRDRTDFLDITSYVQSTVEKSGIKDGVCTIFVPHTTAGITINENADPEVLTDMISALNKIIPWSDADFKHFEGNSAAHLKSSFMGSSQTILFKSGKLTLGRWQAIYFCDFDGPGVVNVRLFSVVAGSKPCSFV